MQPTGVSEACLADIRHHEGVRNKPYRDVVALWTVGVGHLMYPDQAAMQQPERNAYQLKPQDNRTWSDAEVNQLLKDDLKRFESGVLRLCPGPLTQGQMDGLVSFAFNVGLGALQRSGLRAKHNRQDYEGAADEFLKWTKAGGKVFPGLVKRRTAEKNLYLS
jgi:GH24 family phage-related lysozyme (muramidase)